MRYLVKTTAGYTLVFRNVLEFKYTASEAHLFVQLEGRKMNINGVTEIEAGGDYEPWAASFNMIPPKTDGETVEAEEEAPVGDESTDTGYEFPREPSVPIELAMTTFAPLERLDCVGVDDGETTGKISDSIAYGGVVGRADLMPLILNTDYVFPTSRGANAEAVKRVENAIRESDLRFRNAVVSTMADARKRGMVLN